MTPRNQITNSMSMRSSFKTAKLQNFYNEKKFQKSPGNLQNPEIPKEKKIQKRPRNLRKTKNLQNRLSSSGRRRHWVLAIQF